MRGVRLVACLLAAAAVSPLPAADSGSKKTESKSAAQPYSPDEFPLWARDLRRAEVIAFGSLPFTLFFAKAAVDTYRYSQHDWDRRYAPWPLKTAGAVSMTENEFKATFAAACVGALSVALADFIVVKLKRHGERKAAAERPKASYTIERSGPETPIRVPSVPDPADEAR